MDQKRWKQIEDLLQQALDREPGERAGFLVRVCDGDGSLLREVQALLERENEARSFLESPAVTHLQQSPSPVPSQISHYQIKGRLGSGGMGEVFKAHDEKLRRAVALKVLPGEFTSDPQRIKRFEQEALAASRLNHPNIITIFEITHSDDTHFIVEEFVDGSTLRDLLRDPHSQTQHPLKLEQALEIAIQITRALKAAHTAWIIHRDIKPENIMIREDGLVKVLDFGIAKLVGEHETPIPDGHSFAETSTLTTPGAIMGTASYMSPEQARGEPLDGRTDLFSLGTLLYEMVTGVQPFAGSSGAAVLQDLQRTDETVRTSLGQAPKELQPILRRALKHNREERYSSAGEVLEDLNALKFRLENRTTRTIATLGALAVVVAIAIAGVAAFLSVTETWEEKIVRDGHTAAVRRAVFSPDGRLLVSVGEDHQVIVWDFVRRMRLKTLSDHTAPVRTVSFSPDGKWFVTGDENQIAILWDASRLEQVTVWRDQLGPITGSAFSPDGRVLIYAVGAVSIVRETGTWKKLRELPCGIGFGDFIFPKDHVVRNSYFHACDIYTGESLTDMPQDWGGNWAALSPDRKQVASVDSFGYVRFVDLARQKLIKQAHGHHDHGRAVAYSPDGKLLATGAERVVLWDVASMTQIVPLEYESVVWSVAFSPDGRWLVSTHGDGSVLIWDVMNRELEANLREHSGAVRGIAFSADGKKLATASEDHSVIVWDAASGRKETVLTKHETRVAAVAFSPDGRWMASADQSGILVRYDLVHNQTQLVISPRRAEVAYCVAISPDGRFLATTYAIYNAETGEAVVPSGDWSHMYSAAFSGDGRLLIGVTDHSEVVVLETATWREIARQQWTESPLVSMSISPDGNFLVTGEDARKVRLGTINPLQQIGIIGEHNARVKAVAFSPEGTYVASAGDDKMVALWDVSRRKRVATIGTHTSPIYALAFSPDGKRLLTGEHDRSVRQYTRHRTLWGFSLN